MSISQHEIRDTGLTPIGEKQEVERVAELEGAATFTLSRPLWLNRCHRFET